ncbi:MAG TPA: hypothetical protein VGN17_13210 [Bryobacteraceae bacterium]|jgi:hypothetical protein
MKQRLRALLRGPSSSRLLQRFGIDPKPFWLLVDLFGTLSQRREMLNQLGRDRSTLKVVSILYTVIMGVMGLGMAIGGLPAATYLSIFLGMTGLLMFSILIPETSNSLINPVEGLILAHQPIDGATYTAAKLTHLLRIILYLVPVPNLVPAFAGLALSSARWYYPLEHLAAALALGILLALFCCALFGWLLRFVPASRLKSAGQIAEMLPMLAFFSFRFGRANVLRHVPALLSLGWPLAAAALAVSAIIVVLGLRALSGDYLVRVASIASGGSHGSGGAAPTPRRAGNASFSRLLGGQKVYAGFSYLRIMMLRDLQFRRMMLQMLPSLVMLAAVIPSGLKTPPFSDSFTPLHLLPHLFGFLLLTACYSLPHGSFYKGAWIFLTVPGRVFPPFARGIYSALWLSGVGAPHLLSFFVLAWKWSLLDSAVFIAFSMAVVSFYLALELRLIEAVPFSTPPRTSRAAVAMPIMFFGFALAGIAVGLQYFLIFHSPATVILATLVIALGTYWVTAGSLKAFAEAMQFHLALDSGEAAAYYKEIES